MQVAQVVARQFEDTKPCTRSYFYCSYPAFVNQPGFERYQLNTDTNLDGYALRAPPCEPESQKLDAQFVENRSLIATEATEEQHYSSRSQGSTSIPHEKPDPLTCVALSGGSVRSPNEDGSNWGTLCLDIKRILDGMRTGGVHVQPSVAILKPISMMKDPSLLER